ncbi:Eukaryotic translation initiation factor 2D [Auxenochlorella protothecoides]|uniref:Eukaryotic translation initiation factor 2D n=1 Tax=Auxenochlorella protothecoides TaxID=3075 RepID=A0A087SJZ8_AUXPR|nr:Eukaryotic translation initiation factor 2D [Auxenochlorella protothecoides]KFM26052.1 Eukaryotic translation initiation factor 2D [Auxenochlorella protothecoides]
MFKKNITVSQTSLLGGKDNKSLKAAAKKSCSSLSEDQLSDLFSSKALITLSKLNNRSLVYGSEGGDPLFFDPTGHGDRLFPTVYTLARFPDMLEKLYTYSPVSDKVLGGADLFLQGLILPTDQPIPAFLAGSVRALCVPGNPIPFAVGTMAVSRTEAQQAGMKGRGLTILHSFGDLLWQLGSGAAPNAGFTPSRIHPLPDQAGPEDEASPRAKSSVDSPSDDAEPDSPDQTEEAVPSIESLSVAEESSAPPPNGAVSLDEMLEQAVLGGLQTLKAIELPIQFSDFYSKHMLAHRPPGVTFDLKQSKYKKLSKLLDKFSKDKVITQKVVRKQDTISAVDRNHPQLAGFTPAAAPATAPSSASAPAQAPAGPSTSAGLVITPCYRAPATLRPLFGPEAAADKDRLYDAAEVAAALSSYAQQQRLRGAGGTIALDALLRSALFGKKEEVSVGSAIPERALVAKLTDKLQLHHRLTRQTPQGPVSTVRKGVLPPITIAAGKKRGHPITTISHMESFGFVPDDLAKDFQKAFSSSCSVGELPGKQEHDMEITMQGDLGAKVAVWFTAHHGIPAKYIDVKGSKKA